jgi:hypothetical protein
VQCGAGTDRNAAVVQRYGDSTARLPMIITLIIFSAAAAADAAATGCNLQTHISKVFYPRIFIFNTKNGFIDFRSPNTIQMQL